MHLILVFALTFSILTLILLFRINDIIIKRKKISKGKTYKFIKSRLLMNIMISCLVFIFIFWVLPFLLWNFGEKESSNIEKIEMKRTIYVLRESENSMYVGLVEAKGNQKYAFRYERQIDTKPELVPLDKGEIIEIPPGEVPHYEKIVEYKRNRLKDKGIFTAAVNDIYSEIDSVADTKKNIKDWKETVINEKVKLYIPKDSINKDYKLK